MQVLYIAKAPEFTESGEAVLGQCEPYTSGWTLRLYDGGQLDEEILLGTFYELRRIQRKCMGKGADEIRRICEDARAELGDKSGTGAFRRSPDSEEATQILDQKKVEEVVAEMEGAAAGAEGAEEAVWEKAQEQGHVVLKAGGDAALDEMLDFEELSEEALRGSKDLVVDLSRVEAVSTAALEGFERVAKKFAEVGRRFSLADAGDGVVSAIRIMRLDPSLEVKKALDDTKAT